MGTSGSDAGARGRPSPAGPAGGGPGCPGPRSPPPAPAQASRAEAGWGGAAGGPGVAGPLWEARCRPQGGRVPAECRAPERGLVGLRTTAALFFQGFKEATCLFLAAFSRRREALFSPLRERGRRNKLESRFPGFGLQLGAAGWGGARVCAQRGFLFQPCRSGASSPSPFPSTTLLRLLPPCSPVRPSVQIRQELCPWGG